MLPADTSLKMLSVMISKWAIEHRQDRKYKIDKMGTRLRRAYIACLFMSGDVKCG